MLGILSSSLVQHFRGTTPCRFVLKFSFNIYSQIGLVDADERRRNLIENFMDDWTRFPLMHATSYMPEGGAWHRVSIDMSRREFSVHSETDDLLFTRGGLPEQVWFAASFKAEYECDVMLA